MKKIFFLFLISKVCISQPLLKNNNAQKEDSITWKILFNDNVRQSYKDKIGINDIKVDSVFEIEKDSNLKFSTTNRNPALSEGEKYLRNNIVKEDEHQKLQRILTEPQYRRWLEIHTVHVYGGLEAGRKIDSTDIKVAKQKVREKYKNELQASYAQVDSLISIKKFFVRESNRIKSNTSLTEKEQMKEQLTIAEQKDQKIREILNPDQYKKLLEIGQFHSPTFSVPKM